ncbi:unnamed protein product [Rhizophagus irregularis]|nr:unnamed protein product [Rhizophagus irregularis]
MLLRLPHELRQIHADITVKEHLISQLEFAEKQYINMRNQYEQQLDDMQEDLITLQQERDAAVKRAQNASTRDKNSILAGELKARYEHKMNRLIQEATQNATSKNQNETMLKNMRAQIEQLKSEKTPNDKAQLNDVREMTERNQREIQNLRRKKKAAQERMNRLEKN